MSTTETPAQQAARLRRERREAKIREGGSARLDKITSLSRAPVSGTFFFSCFLSTLICRLPFLAVSFSTGLSYGERRTDVYCVSI